MTRLRTTQLDCGLTLVTEELDEVASAAMHWLLPVGAAGDPSKGDGHAALLSELIFRGAGGLNSREHSDALDRVGVQRSCDVTSHHMSLRCSMTGERMGDALPLLTSMVREPAFPDDAIDPVRRLCLQSIESLDDEPQHLVMLRLAEQHFPPPFNRHGYGDPAVIERTDLDTLRDAWRTRCVPAGSILAVAGAFDADQLALRLDDLLAGWSGDLIEPQEQGPAAHGTRHIAHDSAQVHLALGCDAPRESDRHSIIERLGVTVLSGSTSGRLFTEVRQKRSLCYSVGASYRSGRDRGIIRLYAGTTPERAQQTLDVCIEQFEAMRSGVTEDEFQRAVVGLKSHLVMSGESTAARAAAIAHDQYRLGRPRSLDEVAAAIERIGLDDLNAYLARREFGPYTIVSIGPVELRAPDTALTGA